MRVAAATSLGQIGADRAVEPLIRALDDQSPLVRSVAAASLGQIGGDLAIGALALRLEASVSGLSAPAARALGKTENARGREVLLSKLSHDDATVRRAAVSGLSVSLDRVEQALLSRDLDGMEPSIDPHEPIPADLAERVAAGLDVGVLEVRARLRALVYRLGLRLAGQPQVRSSRSG